MTEEEENNQTPKIHGIVYGYIESVEAALPEGNETVIELIFRKESHELSTKREGNLFIVNRRLRLPVHIKTDQDMKEMQEKYILLKLFRITNEGERRQYADYKVNLQHLLKPKIMEVITEEARAKMSNKPKVTSAFAVYLKTDPIPSEMSNFTYEKRHPQTERKPDQTDEINNNNNNNDNDNENLPIEKHLLHLVDDVDYDTIGDMTRSSISIQASYEDSSDSFDEDITMHAIKLASQSSLPAINESIVRSWYDLNKSKPGFPGFQLSKEIVRGQGKVISKESVDRIFLMLDDIRTTTKNEDSSILFFCSTLSFYQNMEKLKKKKQSSEIVEIVKRSKEMCYDAMKTAASIVCPYLKKSFQESLKLEVGSKEFNKILSDIKERIEKKYSHLESLKFLANFIFDQLDCNLTNAIITEKMLSKFGQVVIANSAISEFETFLKVKFNLFRQAILAMIAHENILNNPESCKELVPLMSPTFIFFMYCIIKPDDTLQKALDYKKIENFAFKMNVNFQTNISIEIMYKPEKKELPLSSPEFNFS